MLHRLPAHLTLHDPMAVLSAAGPALLVVAVLPLYRVLDHWPGAARWLPVRDPAAAKKMLFVSV